MQMYILQMQMFAYGKGGTESTGVMHQIFVRAGETLSEDHLVYLDTSLQGLLYQPIEYDTQTEKPCSNVSSKFITVTLIFFCH